MFGGFLKEHVTYQSYVFSYSITQSTRSSKRESAQLWGGEERAGPGILQPQAPVPQPPAFGRPGSHLQHTTAPCLRKQRSQEEG